MFSMYNFYNVPCLRLSSYMPTVASKYLIPGMAKADEVPQ